MRILIIEDDKDLAQLTKLALEKENFTVDICLDGAEGLYYMQENMYDLVLLDRMLPSMDGTQVLKEARQSNISTPVIFLTALGELQDKVNGLNCGADDYMVKPFLPKELTFRIMAILRRSYKNDAPLVILAESEIDFDRAEVRKAGDVLPLTAKEYEILSSLYRNAGKIVTIDTLCEAAWGDNPYGYENSLMAHIRRIREKIEADPSHPVSLVTIKGLGYKLILEE